MCLVIVLWFSDFIYLCFCDNSDSNSSSSDGSRARSVQSSATHAPAQSSMGLDSDEPRRSFGIKVQNLPVRSTGEFLHDLQVLSKPPKESLVKLPFLNWDTKWILMLTAQYR